MANRIPSPILRFKSLAHATDYSAFWLGRHSRTPEKHNDGQHHGKGWPMNCPDVHFDSGDGGVKEYPATDLSLFQETPQSEPVTSGLSLVRNRSAGSAVESSAGTAIDQHISSWLRIHSMSSNRLWTVKERLGYKIRWRPAFGGAEEACKITYRSP